MITLAYPARNAATAERIATDLRQHDYDVADTVQPGRDPILIVVVSAATADDPRAEAMIEDALDAGQQVIPVLVESVELPELIDHFAPLDFTSRYNWNELETRLTEALAPSGRYPLRVKTSKVEAANRRTGFVLVAVAMVMFLIAVYFIGIGIIEVPEEEYAEVDTEVALTRDSMIGPTMQYLSTALPRSTEQSADFPATVQALPTVLRPFFALTATAIHEQLQQFEIATPAAEGTPDAASE